MRADSERKLFPKEWFAGNEQAWQTAVILARLSQVWDDLVDRDEAVSERQINDAFLACLVYLPQNPFYRTIQDAIAPMWLTVVSAYEAANAYERGKDEKGLEIGHVLRFNAGSIIAYILHTCNPLARDIIPEMWKFIVNERFEDYRKEHLNAEV